MKERRINPAQLSIERVLIMDGNIQHRRVLSSFLTKQFNNLKISILDPENGPLPGRDYDWAQFDLVFISLGEHYNKIKQWYQKVADELPPAIFLDNTRDPDEEVIEIMRLGAYDYLAKHKMKPARLMRAIIAAGGRIQVETPTTDVAQDIRTQETQIASHLTEEDIKEISGVMKAGELREYIQQKLDSQGFNLEQPIDLHSQQEEQYATELERTGQVSQLDISKFPSSSDAIESEVFTKTAEIEDDDIPVTGITQSQIEQEKSSVAPRLSSSRAKVESIEQYWPFSIDDIRQGTARIRYYKVIDLIGVGGMATVFKVLRERDGDISAMKILNVAVTDDHTEEDKILRERFIREFEYSKDLSLDHIVNIYTQGFEGSIPYIVMELLQGVDLRARIRKRDISPNMAMIYFRHIAVALDELHKHDIIHRDLKPSNIMFRNDGTLVVADFGVSKKLSGQNSEALTREGQMVGTPYYVSPEQVLGHEMDERSDLYALGIILYEMLIGRHPYHGKKTIEVMYAHARDPVPLLPHEFDNINDILVRLLAKEAKDRFSSAADVIKVIDEMESFF